jgi:hypothetical protein
MLKDAAKWEANLSTDEGVVGLRCNLHLKVRYIRVIVIRVIMVMVRGQIFSGEVVITSWPSKDISYRGIKLGAQTNMGSTVGLLVSKMTKG